MSLGEIIRNRRERLGMTQDQVAAAAGISKPYLSNIETGKPKNPPSDRVLRSLERVLKFAERELTDPAHFLRSPPDVRNSHEQLQAQVERLRNALLDISRKHNETPAVDGAAPAADGQADASLAQADSAPQSAALITAGRLVPIINKVAAGYPRYFTDLDYPPGVADDYIRCPDLHDANAFATRVVGDSMEPMYHEGDVIVFAPNTPAQSGDDCFVRFDAEDGTTFKRFYPDDENTIRLQPLNSRYKAENYPREKITGLWPAVFRFERINRR